MTLLTTLFLGAQIANVLAFLVVLFLTNIVHSALGALVAVSVKEVFEAQTLSNYFRFPMIFLCGIFLPLEKMPAALRVLARLLPLTYSVGALRAIMVDSSAFFIEIMVLIGFSIFLPYLSIFLFRKNQE
jgi:ABC-2 type transport system permease protein